MNNFVLKDKDLKVFWSYINSINQIWKNVKPDNTYTINNGIIYAIQDDDEEPLHITGIMNYDKLSIQEAIDSLSCVINGKTLFDIIKNNKKFIINVNIANGIFKFYLDNDTILNTDVCTSLNDINNNDMLMYKNLIKRIGDSKYICKKNITKDEITNITAKEFATTIYIGKNKKHKVILSRGVLKHFKNTDIEIKIYRLLTYKKLYLLTLKSIYKNFSIIGFAVIC